MAKQEINNRLEVMLREIYNSWRTFDQQDHHIHAIILHPSTVELLHRYDRKQNGGYFSIDPNTNVLNLLGMVIFSSIHQSRSGFRIITSSPGVNQNQ